ncbi:hypothetical protein G6M14_17860 [Agrobacterium tumefaciens]|uniref:hypothetical protein n=1 Tax=Agrobacterium tumefaciens TaxID=358 RepID=UPI001573BD80|nr:hypothetical protein [Agrobacterium tumefaciens]
MAVATHHTAIFQAHSFEFGFQRFGVINEVERVTNNIVVSYVPPKFVITSATSFPHINEHIVVFLDHSFQAGEAALKHRKCSREPSVEVRQGIRELLPLRYFMDAANISPVRFYNVAKPSPIRFARFIHRIIVGTPEVLDCLFHIMQLRVQSSLERSNLSSDSKCHYLLMAFMLSPVDLDCRPYRQESCDDCQPTGDKRLEVINEISPTIACLTGNSAWEAENDWQTDCDSDHQTGQYPQTLLVQLRQRFPLTPFNSCERSHFSNSFGSSKGGAA